MFGVVYTIGLIYNAMSKSKSMVSSIVSCSFVYHSHRVSAHLKLFFDALSPLATKMRRLISQPQFYGSCHLWYIGDLLSALSPEENVQHF